MYNLAAFVKVNSVFLALIQMKNPSLILFLNYLCSNLKTIIFYMKM